jgi:hypothetical protein
MNPLFWGKASTDPKAYFFSVESSNSIIHLYPLALVVWSSVCRAACDDLKQLSVYLTISNNYIQNAWWCTLCKLARNSRKRYAWNWRVTLKKICNFTFDKSLIKHIFRTDVALPFPVLNNEFTMPGSFSLPHAYISEAVTHSSSYSYKDKKSV